jgi:hypothetical protein
MGVNGYTIFGFEIQHIIPQQAQGALLRTVLMRNSPITPACPI